MSDKLQHNELAASLLKISQHFPAGAVIAVEGPWGRGKTDVLNRLYSMEMRVHDDPVRNPIVLNPWLEQRADFLAPLHLEATLRLQAAPPGPVRAGLEKLVGAVGGVGVALGMFGLSDDPDAKAAVAVGTMAGKLVESAAEFVTGRVQAAPDPSVYGVGGHRLLVLVDDMDRATPDRQIEWLEALYFVRDAQPDCVFVVFVDTDMLAVSLKHRYPGAAFDAQRYLDKIFDMRVRLPAMTDAHSPFLLVHQLERTVGGAPVHAHLAKLGLAVDGDVVASLLQSPAWVPAFQNPRFTRRMVDRLAFVALCAPPDQTLGACAPDMALLWFALRCRYPQLRRLEGRPTDLRKVRNWASGTAGLPATNPSDPVEALLATVDTLSVWRLVQHIDADADRWEELQAAAHAWGDLLSHPELSHL